MIRSDCRCSTCGRVALSGHRCPPKFIANIGDYHGDDINDGYEIFACDAAEAAELAAEHYEHDGADYSIASGNSDVVVTVTRTRDQAIRKFRVTGEVVPSYTAEAVD